ncbi:hypothetical protein CEXT_714901 [Caerostris extrusa]|uniref:Uncharacterized protein n=1 Tax=Caerostris extrusa TaxID=172846 RepID=A0AAV4N1G4_CAEEX|nr:hypothetical protein CEXT_714901 [Caerostris extrusa]
MLIILCCPKSFLKQGRAVQDGPITIHQGHALMPVLNEMSQTGRGRNRGEHVCCDSSGSMQGITSGDESSCLCHQWVVFKGVNTSTFGLIKLLLSVEVNV